MSAIVIDEGLSSNVEVGGKSIQKRALGIPLIIDVSPAAYAEIRDQLREHGHGENVGNKLIHLGDIPLRERDPGKEGIGIAVLGLLFVSFAAFVIWVVAHFWGK